MTHRQILFVIFGLMAGMFLSALDQTVVGTAIRTIGDDLHGLSLQAWVTTAYLIVSTIATPIYGKLSDIFGRRPLFILAIVVVSLLSRVWRSTELRTPKIEMDEQAMAFVNALAFVAHEQDHHPDLGVHYDRCVVRFSTHDVGGLSENDFICAAKADALLG